MAAIWICESCGRANNGDSCPACGEHKPFTAMVSTVSDASRSGARWIVQESTDRKPVSTTFVWGSVYVAGAILAEVLNAYPIFFAATGVLTLYLIWKYAFLEQRVAYLRSRKRKQS